MSGARSNSITTSKNLPTKIPTLSPSAKRTSSTNLSLPFHSGFSPPPPTRSNTASLPPPARPANRRNYTRTSPSHIPRHAHMDCDPADAEHYSPKLPADDPPPPASPPKPPSLNLDSTIFAVGSLAM